MTTPEQEEARIRAAYVGGQTYPPIPPAERRDRTRRAVLMTRALHNPEGLTKYEYTKGFTKADSIRFWVDAGVLGFVRLGVNSRGTARYGLRSEAVE